ncbi:hypothetical protein ACXYRR_00715 [Mycoplasma sp. 246B]
MKLVVNLDNNADKNLHVYIAKQKNYDGMDKMTNVVDLGLYTKLSKKYPWHIPLIESAISDYDLKNIVNEDYTDLKAYIENALSEAKLTYPTRNPNELWLTKLINNIGLFDHFKYDKDDLKNTVTMTLLNLFLTDVRGASDKLIELDKIYKKSDYKDNIYIKALNNIWKNHKILYKNVQRISEQMTDSKILYVAVKPMTYAEFDNSKKAGTKYSYNDFWRTQKNVVAAFNKLGAPVFVQTYNVTFGDESQYLADFLDAYLKMFPNSNPTFSIEKEMITEENIHYMLENNINFITSISAFYGDRSDFDYILDQGDYKHFKDGSKEKQRDKKLQIDSKTYDIKQVIIWNKKLEHEDQMLRNEFLEDYENTAEDERTLGNLSGYDLGRFLDEDPIMDLDLESIEKSKELDGYLVYKTNLIDITASMIKKVDSDAKQVLKNVDLFEDDIRNEFWYIYQKNHYDAYNLLICLASFLKEYIMYLLDKNYPNKKTKYTRAKLQVMLKALQAKSVFNQTTNKVISYQLPKENVTKPEWELYNDIFNIINKD